MMRNLLLVFIILTLMFPLLAHWVVIRGPMIPGMGIWWVILLNILLIWWIALVRYWARNHVNIDWYTNYQRPKMRGKAKIWWNRLWVWKILLIIIWWVALIFLIYWLSTPHNDSDCEKIYNDGFEGHFWAEITKHKVKYSQRVNGCVAYIELEQYVSFQHNYFLEYEVYQYKKWDMDRG